MKITPLRVEKRRRINKDISLYLCFMFDKKVIVKIIVFPLSQNICLPENWACNNKWTIDAKFDLLYVHCGLKVWQSFFEINGIHDIILADGNFCWKTVSNRKLEFSINERFSIENQNFLLGNRNLLKKKKKEKKKKEIGFSRKLL